MSNTINGRTPEEIKKGLECSHTKHCIFKSCPYYAQDEESSACIDQSRADALFLINQLQEDKKQLKAERDAAVLDLEMCCSCEVCTRSCKYDKVNAYAECADFEWRGPEVE